MVVIRKVFQFFFYPTSNISIDATNDVNTQLVIARERILTALLRSAAIFATLTIMYLAGDLIAMGGFGTFGFYLFCLGLIWSIAIFRQIPHRVRATIICGILYAMGLFDLLFYGIGEDWRLFLICFSVLTLLFAGRRAGVLATLLSVVTFFIIGWMRSNGIWTVNYSPFTIAEPSINVIIIYSMTFLTTVGLTIVALSALLTEFESALFKEREVAGLLLDERNTLETRVQERTHELHARNRELAASQRKAETANEAKSRFLSHISHELRTPMNGVLGMTSLLLKTNLDVEQLDIVSTIRNSGDTMLTLINDLLDLSKVEANKIELEAVRFDLSQCIEESLELVSPLAAEKDLNIAYFVAPETPSYWIQDVTRLRQVLTNLLSNAVKFTDTGEIIVSVEAKPVQDDLYKLFFTIEDTGIGIPPEMQNRLFQSFSQGEISTARRYGGTGLGLSISKHLCKLMGGDISLYSQEKVGSVFSFSVMARRSPLAEQPKIKDCPYMIGKRLLLVESNKTNSRVLARCFDEWNVISTTKDIGTPHEEILEVCHNIDLLIFDWQPSNAVAIALLTAIQESFSSLPIIVLAMRYQHMLNPQLSQKMLVATKPIRPQSLRMAIRSIMGCQTNDETTHPLIGEARVQQKTLRILLAEDNIVNQKVMLGILKRCGYQADVAANGIEVLQAFGRQFYDVILMDINMPEMDGVTATKRIREEIPTAKQPFIAAITANAMEDEREEYLQIGMDDYISKPVSIEKLTVMLEVAQSRQLIARPENRIRQSENMAMV